MSEMNFRREIVKKCIAQMCINIGWEGITANALDTLTNILENYFFSVAHHTHLASEIKGLPEISFQDLHMSFNKLDISLADLMDYILLADHNPLPKSVPYFPASRHKTAHKSEHKTVRDNQTPSDKKQGSECLTPVKNPKVIPEEAEASQYEMRSFSLITLENGDLFPQNKGHAPSSKVHHLLPTEEPAQKFSKAKSSASNLSKLFADVHKEKVENVQSRLPKQIHDNVNEESSSCNLKLQKLPLVTPKKHRKPTIKEAFIAKKKQSKSAKLASSVVKLDASDVTFEIKKRRPGRKPKKVPKSRSRVVETDEINVETQISIDACPGVTEKGCGSLMEVVNTVVEETLVGEENDTMLGDDLELGTVNDEILVEIADRGGDSPLSHLPGIPIQNREFFHNSDLFGNSCSSKDAPNLDPHVNIDVEEEILPWSDDEKSKNDQTNVNIATGLELLLRSQGDKPSMGSTSQASQGKHHRDINFQINDKDKRRYKKLKKLKKNQKQEKVQKLSKNKHVVREEPDVVPLDKGPFESIAIFSEEQNDKYMTSKLVKPEEMLEDNFAHIARTRKISEGSDYNDSELDVIGLSNKGLIEPLQSTDFVKNTQENPTEFAEITHKKKKKKGKRKLEDFDGVVMPKFKKFRKQESLEAPIIPKLTLKFGGATVCGGDTSSPGTQRDHCSDHANRHSLPAPIKLVIKPFATNHGSEQNRRAVSPVEMVHSPHVSPLPHHESLSPDQLSLPSVALSSRSPSPNDIARLASGPSHRKNISPIYSESPSPPHEGQSSSKVFNPKKHVHPDVKQKNKEPKSIPVKSCPINKSSVNKSSKSAITSETVGKITKANGEIIWICPTCGCPDSGTPMIGCDRCDDWYHWVCVNITKEPPAEMNWYCVRCLNQNPSLKSQMPGKRGRPAGKGKSKK